MARERIVYGEAVRKALLARSKRRRVWLGERIDHPDDRGDDPATRYPDPGGKSQSYVVPCPAGFRDAVLDLAQRKRATVGVLARAVAALLPGEVVALWPDPAASEPDASGTGRRNSGRGNGKTPRQQPRLQVRMTAGLEPADIRRMLAVALAMDAGELVPRPDEGRDAVLDERLQRAENEVARLRTQLRAIVPDPLKHAVRNHAEALHVMGFAPAAEPDSDSIRKRYRTLAAIHHPDSGKGDHVRMSQLNAAARILRRR